MEVLSPAFASMASSGSSSRVVGQSCGGMCFAPQSIGKSSFSSGFGLSGLRCPVTLQHTYTRNTPLCASVSTSDKISDVPESVEAEAKHNPLAPNAFEVQSLLMEVCDETSIAELQLKIGAFKLHMKRDVGKLKGASAPATPIAPPVPSKPMVQSETSVPSASITGPPAVPTKTPLVSTASFLATPASKPGSRFGLLEAAADEGLLFVTSPKVGLFRRSRVVKKKSGRPLCEEGQVIKEGQVVCYVEQLGTQQPVEAENSGEVVKILWRDGESVGYGDPLIAIRPSFPGINII